MLIQCVGFDRELINIVKETAGLCQIAIYIGIECCMLNATITRVLETKALRNHRIDPPVMW
ncbi:Protein of unknown function [Pyronema omphalodes CBS 100304]|uniref:Uncharacterized protein n=1 Tax=Pyronema omphalodes (strain CBS 100304) TaxID=1076935 RepID=U4LTT4_PYROM|nr:Protein of unknown function [Pyronema omphalodes CBS 100304]